MDWDIKLKFRSLKRRILIWFGSLAFVVLALFSFAFNYFLDQSINNNIESKLQFTAHKYKADQNTVSPRNESYIKAQSTGIAIIHNGIIKNQNDAFTLKDYARYLQQKQRFFILTHDEDDDYIDALYIEKLGNNTIMVFQKDIDNKIENFQDVLLFLIPILLFVLIFLASKMVDKVLIPINKLTSATKDITVTRFTKSIDLPEEHDEIRELVESFNTMIQRLKNGVERLDRFNSDVSHELKTPLTVIQGEVEITLRKLRKPQEYEKSLHTIQKQSKQIEGIVKQLLLLTRYAKENVDASFELCSLDALLMTAVDRFQGELVKKNLKLHIERIEPISLNANPVLIESIFVNLLDNAIKYTPENKNIYIDLYRDTKINFVIKDEGIGVEEAQLSKITERFYRADSSRSKKVEGFGLGLSIVQNSIDLHRGTLKIDSQPNKGTKITVSL